MPRQPDTPTTVASTGTEVVAMFGIGRLSVVTPPRFLKSPSWMVVIEIVDSTRTWPFGARHARPLVVVRKTV